MRIVVTGGIGCGKSTVIRALRERLPHYDHFNFDACVHGLYDSAQLRTQLRRVFGTDDRKRVSELVFANHSRMHELDHLTRGPLQAELRKALQSRHVLVEFPLLLECAWSADEVDFIVDVTCDTATQRARIAERDKASEIKIDRILNSQFSGAAKAALADVVIDTGSGGSLERQLDEAVRAIRLGELRQIVTQDYPVAVWKEVQRAYSEPQRHYHTLNHLADMFAEYRRYESDFHFPRVARRSITMHDLRYDIEHALYATNEARSARASVEMLREYAPAQLSEAEQVDGRLTVGTVGLVAEFILCTKGHQIVSPYLQSHPRALADAKLFLDIDLSVLSAAPEICERFDDNIRKEFSIYHDKIFATERAKVLRSFLERERIYFSEQFADREAAARDNLARLIAKWDFVAKNAVMPAVAQ